MDRVRKTDEEWRVALTPEEYRVLREHGTERAWSHPYNTEHRDGQFLCAGCGAPLFSSDAKFDSGSGWPSYFDALDGAVDTTIDRSHGMVRTEMHCRRCGGHLGHVFDDGPQPTGLRYCTNGTSLRFVPKTPGA
jgi:peptide-methionine (R)-S-oxide reductase